MTSKEKNELLDKLSVCYNRTNYCKILCEEKGKEDEAAKLERRKNRLRTEIDGLLHDLYQNWIGSAKNLKSKVDTANKEVNKLIKEIEKNIKLTQNIVKFIGYVDDVIKVAAGLVK